MASEDTLNTLYTFRENKEQLPIQFFGLNLQNHFGNCSPSVDLLSLVRARSIPWDRLANSFNSTIFSKNSMFSGEIVTFNDIFFCFTMFNKGLCEDLNIDNDNLPITTKHVVGGSIDGKHRANSASYTEYQKRTLRKKQNTRRNRHARTQDPHIGSCNDRVGAGPDRRGTQEYGTCVHGRIGTRQEHYCVLIPEIISYSEVIA